MCFKKLHLYLKTLSQEAHRYSIPWASKIFELFWACFTTLYSLDLVEGWSLIFELKAFILWKSLLCQNLSSRESLVEWFTQSLLLLWWSETWILHSSDSPYSDCWRGPAFSRPCPPDSHQILSVCPWSSASLWSHRPSLHRSDHSPSFLGRLSCTTVSRAAPCLTDWRRSLALRRCWRWERFPGSSSLPLMASTGASDNI